MVITSENFYAFFGSIGLLFIGFMSITYNRSISHSWIHIINDVFHFIYPKASKVSKYGVLYVIIRFGSIIIGILGFALAFIVLQKFISFI